MTKLPWILLILVIGVIGLTFVFKACDQSPAQSDIKAQYVVTADRTIYYTDAYTAGFDKNGRYYVLNGYWRYTGEQTGWRYVNADLYLSERGYTVLTVKKR